MLLNSNAGRVVRDGEATGSGNGPGFIAPSVVLGVVTLGALVHPNPLVLGVLGALLVVAGFVMAGLIMLRHRRQSQAMADRLQLPGLLLFFGFLAAALCDADRAVQNLTHLAL